MRPLLKAIDAACLGAANVAAAMLVVVALVAIAEVVLRAIFNYGLSWALEYESYALCLVMFAGSGWALRHGGHIKVELFVNLLPPTARRLIDLAATAFALGISVYVSVALVAYAWATFQRGTVSIHISQTPLAYPQALFALAVCSLPLAFLARLVRLLRREAPEAPQQAAPETGV